MTEVTLLTPTGGRPEAFEICSKLIAKQTFQNWKWVVVDDGPEPIQSNLVANKCEYLRPFPLWAGKNTQKRNLQVGLKSCDTEWVAFIEDDDWYHPEYLERSINKAKEGFKAVGEANAHYYHLTTGRHRRMGNKAHASLCQMVIHRSLLPIFSTVLHNNERFFDCEFWKAVSTQPDIGSFLFPSSTHSLGIKGFPGRFGIGAGHRPKDNWEEDDGSVFKQIVGSDYHLYEKFLCTQKV